MIRFFTGIYDAINHALTGETTIRMYDKKTGELKNTLKMIPTKDGKPVDLSNVEDDDSDSE